MSLANLLPIPRGHQPKRPKWEQDPHILVRIVEETRKHGQWRLAAIAEMVTERAIENWVTQGKKEAELYDDDNDVETTPLCDFYLALKQAQALHAMGVIEKMHDLAENGGPEYRNYYMWILENTIEGKPYSRFVRVEEKRDITIKVERVSGDEWTGRTVKAITDGSVIDTTMKEIEDF